MNSADRMLKHFPASTATSMFEHVTVIFSWYQLGKISLLQPNNNHIMYLTYKDVHCKVQNHLALDLHNNYHKFYCQYFLCLDQHKILYDHFCKFLYTTHNTCISYAQCKFTIKTGLHYSMEKFAIHFFCNN